MWKLWGQHWLGKKLPKDPEPRALHQPRSLRCFGLLFHLFTTLFPWFSDGFVVATNLPILQTRKRKPGEVSWSWQGVLGVGSALESKSIEVPLGCCPSPGTPSTCTCCPLPISAFPSLYNALLFICTDKHLAKLKYNGMYHLQLFKVYLSFKAQLQCHLLQEGTQDSPGYH